MCCFLFFRAWMLFLMGGTGRGMPTQRKGFRGAGVEQLRQLRVKGF